MKTLRFDFHVLADSDADALLDLVTKVRGVVAAVRRGSALEVVLESAACAPLVREELSAALAAAGPGVAA